MSESEQPGRRLYFHGTIKVSFTASAKMRVTNPAVSLRKRAAMRRPAARCQHRGAPVRRPASASPTRRVRAGAKSGDDPPQGDGDPPGSCGRNRGGR